MDGQKVILFDGVCNLCNGFVDFVIRRDPKGRFLLGSLQSDSAKRLLSDQASLGDLSSILLVDQGRIHQRSSAVLRVAQGLRWPWPFLFVFILVPPFIRNAVYDVIAARRYRWFGKRDTCRLPTAEEKSRFLP